jgi:hypothetical protein
MAGAAAVASDSVDADAVVGEVPDVGLAVAFFPACETVTVLPATVTVPVRVAPVFAATDNVVEPLPLPLVGDAVTHDTLDFAIQLHALVVETLTFFVALPAPGDQVVGDTL